jgi:hypothetical protein
MPTLLKVLAAATAILAVIELVRGQPLVRWRRRQEHPSQTRGHALSLLLLVASEHASFELHAANLGYVLIGLALVVLLGAAIVATRQDACSQGRSSPSTWTAFAASSSSGRILGHEKPCRTSRPR